MTPAQLELVVREPWKVNDLKLLHLDKITYFGRIFKVYSFTF